MRGAKEKGSGRRDRKREKGKRKEVIMRGKRRREVRKAEIRWKEDRRGNWRSEERSG